MARTLAELAERRNRLSIHCNGGGDRHCTHFSEVAWSGLIARFGADFDLISNRERFLGRFRCSKCGGKRATLIIAPPPRQNGTPGKG